MNETLDFYAEVIADDVLYSLLHKRDLRGWALILLTVKEE